MNKITLGVSSYSSFLKISLTNGEKYLNYSEKITNFEEVMFERIKKMLKIFKCDFKDISKICLVRGPGRFTGIRSSYAFASVYTALSGCEVRGVDVFELLTYNVFEKDKRDKKIRTVLNAFKDEYYLADYEIKKEKIFLKATPVWISKENLFKKMKGFDGLLITDNEDNPGVYDLFSEYKKADLSLSKVICENIIKAANYFDKKDISPFYLKPAKFEL